MQRFVEKSGRQRMSSAVALSKCAKPLPFVEARRLTIERSGKGNTVCKPSLTLEMRSLKPFSCACYERAQQSLVWCLRCNHLLLTGVMRSAQVVKCCSSREARRSIHPVVAERKGRYRGHFRVVAHKRYDSKVLPNA